MWRAASRSNKENNPQERSSAGKQQSNNSKEDGLVNYEPEDREESTVNASIPSAFTPVVSKEAAKSGSGTSKPPTEYSSIESSIAGDADIRDSLSPPPRSTSMFPRNTMHLAELLYTTEVNAIIAVWQRCNEAVELFSASSLKFHERFVKSKRRVEPPPSKQTAALWPPFRRAFLLFFATTSFIVVAYLTLWGKAGAVLPASPVRIRSQSPTETVNEVRPEHGELESGYGAEEEQAVAEQVKEAAEDPQDEGSRGIKRIAIIAERHSGSTWMKNFLNVYFRDADVEVMSTLCTWKHWFQDRIHEDIQNGKRPCRQAQPCPACHDTEHTLVVAMWRNPYDWISGMHRIPHHAVSMGAIEDLSEFMTTRWMMGAQEEHSARVEAMIKARDHAPCMDNFLPWEVVPCRENDRNSIYELDLNGEAYSNLYELRKAKIRDFNAVREWAPHYERVRYEDMVVDDGLRDWLVLLETKYGLSGNHEAVPAPSLREKMDTSRGGMYYLNSTQCAPQCEMGGMEGRKAVETLHALWDTELEAGLGYHKVGA